MQIFEIINDAKILYLTGLISITLLLLLAVFLIVNKIIHPAEVKSVFTQSRLKRLSFKLVNIIFKNRILIMVCLTVFIFLSFAALALTSPQIISPDGPSFGTKIIDDLHPIKFTFDRPVDPKRLKIAIKPVIGGTIKHNYRFDGFILKHDFFFYPNTSLPTESEYSVTVSSIKSIIGIPEGKEYLFNLKTPLDAKIISVSPQDKAENIDINTPILVNFDFDDKYRTQWDFQLNPEIPLTITKKGKNTVLQPKSPLLKGTNYQFIILKTPIAYSFKKRQIISRGESSQSMTAGFKTVVSPTIKSFSPTGSGVLVDSPITIQFRQEMDSASVEKAWSLTPAVTGTFTWKDSNQFTFIPSSGLAKNTLYKITIENSASTKFGTGFDANFTSQFTTIGPITASISPANNASSIPLNRSITVAFNQEVDHISAQTHFSISPQVEGIFSWQSNTMTFKPNTNYQNSQTYTVTVNNQIKSIKGLDSTAVYTSKFKTIDQRVKLNIPLYKQEHYYTCGIAAARMALAYKGVKLSEMNIVNQIGYDSTPLNASKTIWGNPNVAFVGTLMGVPKGTGYGVHWGPVAKVVSKYRPAEVKQNWNVQGIATEIQNGNPVVIWWVNGVWPSFERSWKTPDGTTIRAVNAMHAVVVNGFTGSVDNPKSFSVSDPWWPRKDYDVSLFKSYWHWFGNTAIIVR